MSTLRMSLLAAAFANRNHKTEEEPTPLDEQLKYLLLFERKKCSALLFFGALFGFLGFQFAFIIGFYKFCDPHVSEFHVHFPSGYGYFPSTVSEMVHNPQDPAGKCFFAFEFVGALLIFMSWYPWELRNVYVGDSTSISCLNQLSWPMFRQFVPSIGMMIVACVTSTPFAQANVLDCVCISIHIIGALMLFVGYAMAEAKTIGFLNIKAAEVTAKTVGEKERKVRKAFLAGLIVAYLAFCTITVMLGLPLDQIGGKPDVWEPKWRTTSEGHKEKLIVLVDTASGFVLGLKIASYALEVMCGICLIGSFFTIWYFCEERHSDLMDELHSVHHAA